jgi:hypothetical protein
VIRGSRGFQRVVQGSIGFRVCVFGILAGKEKCLYKRTYPPTVQFPFLFLHIQLFVYYS